MAIVINGSVLALGYAIIASMGLLFALLIGYRLHFSDIVQTHCKVPEFWPSISATTGDFIEGKSIWRAATVFAFPFRITASYFMYKLYAGLLGGNQPSRGDDGEMSVSTPGLMFIFDLIRMGTAVMWTMVSSSEALIPHEAAFVFYVISGFLLQVTQVILAGRVQNQLPNGRRSYQMKLWFFVGQTVFAVLVGKFFVDHMATCAPGVYSRSTMSEWCFAFCNIAFDATQALDLQQEQIVIGAGNEKEHSKQRNAIPAWAMYVVDIFFGFNYFSIVLQLFQDVYFMPMVAMEYTLDSVFTLAPAATLLLAIKPVQRIVSGMIGGYPAYIVLYALSVPFMFLSFDHPRNVSMRIFMVGMGAFFVNAALYTRLFLTRHPIDTTNADITRLALSLPLGLVVNMCARLMFVSLDPLHVHAVYNLMCGLVVGGICVFVIAKKATYVLRNSREDLEGRIADNDNDGSSRQPAMPGWAMGGAFGSIVSLSFVMLTNSGILPRYIGLDPYPYGVYIIITFLAGLFLAPKVTINNRNPIISVALLFVGFLIFYSSTIQSNRLFEKKDSPTYPTSHETPIEKVSIDNWYAEEMSGSPMLAFIGALAMVFGVGSLWPMVMEHAVMYQRFFRMAKHGRVSLPAYDLALNTAQLLPLLMHVYVVCFPFVPMGFLFRDRVYIPYMVSFITLTVSLVTVCKFNAHAGIMYSTKARVGKLPGLIGVCMLVLLSVCIIGRVVGAPANQTLPAYAAGPTDAELALARRIATAQVAGHEYTPKAEEEPLVEDVKSSIASINAIIWTVHFGQDDYGGDSTYRMIDLIKEQNPGIVGILESDAARPMNGNRDYIEHIGYSLGFDYVDYGPTTFDSTFGCALITKYPIVYIRRYVSPSPVGELACLIHSRLNIHGVITNVYVGHNGNTQHTPDRRLQSQLLGKLAVENPGPSIFLGYLTTAVAKDNYHWFANPASERVGGLFRDTAYSMYREREWERIDNDGYVGTVDPEDESLPALEQQYKRPPPGEKLRVFRYPDLQRNSTAHPRFEYLDRYCQYMLYKTGNPLEEKSMYNAAPYELKLLNWHRVLDVHELSDTEIQLGQFLFHRPEKS